MKKGRKEEKKNKTEKKKKEKKLFDLPQLSDVRILLTTRSVSVIFASENNKNKKLKKINKKSEFNMNYY